MLYPVRCRSVACLGQLAGNVGYQADPRLARRDTLQHLGEVQQHRVHQIRVKRVRDGQPMRPSSQCRNPIHHLADGGFRA